ncbi:MAG: hypothetical protein FWG66_09850 [Spirochaetes bacterium]|nr:hypothetical protein [Spirochaetota bacterium]
MQMTFILAFAIIVCLQGLGDVVSAKTKGKVPSIFVACVLFLAGFWTIIPTQIAGPSGATVTLTQMAGISGSLFSVMLALLVTNMGTLMSVKELFAQWKTIVIGVVAVIAAVAAVYWLGAFLFEPIHGIVVAPSLVGGLAAVNMMMQASGEAGRPDLATIAILIFSMQGLVGYPLMNFFLRRQAKNVLDDYKAGKIALKGAAAGDATVPPWKIIPDTPSKYQTPIVLISKLVLVTFIADSVSTLTGGAVNTLVLCLVFGITATELGFLEKKLLAKAETMGIMMIVLMGFVFGGLANATPSVLMEVFAPLVTLFFLGTGMLVFVGIAIGKMFFKETWAMSGAIVLNCLCGFPPNFVLTNETSKNMSANDSEYEILMQEMLPKVLVGGFATVTVTSVIIADIFTRFI